MKKSKGYYLLKFISIKRSTGLKVENIIATESRLRKKIKSKI